MIEIARVVENQTILYPYRATQNEDRAQQLELLIEITKPQNHFDHWHPLIATPFRYSPPHPSARFRPRYGKNVFYGSLNEETALYEHAFHFMKERIHLEIDTQAETRTIFFVDANDGDAVNLSGEANLADIINKEDYSASQQFVLLNQEVRFILYPSCRDPERRNNAAILDIKCLNKDPKWEASIKFFYDNNKKQITWIDYQLPIQWSQLI